MSDPTQSDSERGWTLYLWPKTDIVEAAVIGHGHPDREGRERVEVVPLGHPTTALKGE